MAKVFWAVIALFICLSMVIEARIWSTTTSSPESDASTVEKVESSEKESADDEADDAKKEEAHTDTADVVYEEAVRPKIAPTTFDLTTTVEKESEEKPDDEKDDSDAEDTEDETESTTEEATTEQVTSVAPVTTEDTADDEPSNGEKDDDEEDDDCELPFISIPGTDGCFYVNNSNGITWLSAKEECSKLGATLVTLDCKEKNEAVWNHVRNGNNPFHRYWIGLYDNNHKNSFIWDRNGQLTNFQNFYTRNTSNSHECMYMSPQKWNEKWIRTDCNQKHQFICEALPPCPNPEQKCEDFKGYISVRNAGCLHFHNSSVNNWIGAKEYCTRISGRLIVVETEDKFQAIRNHIHYELPASHSRQSYWLGLYDTYHESKWYWDGLGIETIYSGFATGEPSGGVTHNCAYLNYAADYYWTDSQCNKELNYICEIPPRCVTDEDSR